MMLFAVTVLEGAESAMRRRLWVQTLTGTAYEAEDVDERVVRLRRKQKTKDANASEAEMTYFRVLWGRREPGFGKTSGRLLIADYRI
jgi:hypothetical protein